MNSATQDTKSRGNIHTFVRNRYFYGKLLDVFHFELEQNYLNGKRWMLNRMVTACFAVSTCGPPPRDAR